MQSSVKFNYLLTCVKFIEKVVVGDVGEKGEYVAYERQYQKRLPPVVIGPRSGKEAEEDRGKVDEQEVPSLELSHALLNALLHGFVDVALGEYREVKFNRSGTQSERRVNLRHV